MCWSSVTCSQLVSYAHWPLGRAKALMFRDLLRLKSSAEPAELLWSNVQFEISPWQIFRHLDWGLFFFLLLAPFGEHLCVSRRWTQSTLPAAGAELRCMFPDLLISAICSTPVGDLSQHDVNPALMKSALVAFGFTQTFNKSVPGKFSLC